MTIPPSSNLVQITALLLVTITSVSLGESPAPKTPLNTRNAALLYFQAIAVGPARNWLRSEVYEETSARDPGPATREFALKNEAIFSLLLSAASSTRCEWNQQAIARPGSAPELTAPIHGSFKSLVTGLSFYFYWHANHGNPMMAREAACAIPRLLDHHPTMQYLPFSPLRAQLDDIAFQYLKENVKSLDFNGQKQLFQTLRTSDRIKFTFPSELYVDYLKLIASIEAELENLADDEVHLNLLRSIESKLNIVTSTARISSSLSRVYIQDILERNRVSAQQFIEISEESHPLVVRELLATTAREQIKSEHLSFDLKAKETLSFFDADVVRRIRWHMLFVLLGSTIEGDMFIEQNPNPITGSTYSIQKKTDSIVFTAPNSDPLDQIELSFQGSSKPLPHNK